MTLGEAKISRTTTTKKMKRKVNRLDSVKLRTTAYQKAPLRK